jgi:hypothetical protein
MFRRNPDISLAKPEGSLGKTTKRALPKPESDDDAHRTKQSRDGIYRNSQHVNSGLARCERCQLNFLNINLVVRAGELASL